jgi:hypothetical protein
MVGFMEGVVGLASHLRSKNPLEVLKLARQTPRRQVCGAAAAVAVAGLRLTYSPRGRRSIPPSIILFFAQTYYSNQIKSGLKLMFI